MVTTLHLFSICLVLVGLKSLSSLVLPSRQTGHSNVAAVWQRSTHLNFAGFGKPTTAEDAVGGKKKGGFARGEVTTSPVSPSDVPDTADPCACGSGRAYGACCGRLHTAVTSLVTRTSEFEVHTAAAAALSAFSAEDVLRARYTAYKVSVVSPWLDLIPPGQHQRRSHVFSKRLPAGAPSCLRPPWKPSARSSHLTIRFSPGPLPHPCIHTLYTPAWRAVCSTGSPTSSSRRRTRCRRTT